MSDNYVVITRDNCTFCTQAKMLLTRFDQEYTEFNVHEHPVFRTFLKTQGLHTVPQVYRNGQLIGGYEELAETFARQLELFDR